MNLYWKKEIFLHLNIGFWKYYIINTIGFWNYKNYLHLNSRKCACYVCYLCEYD